MNLCRYLQVDTYSQELSLIQYSYSGRQRLENESGAGNAVVLALPMRLSRLIIVTLVIKINSGCIQTQEMEK